MDTWLYILLAVIGSGVATALVNWWLGRRASNVDILRAMNDYNKDVTSDLLAARQERQAFEDRILTALGDTSATTAAQAKLKIVMDGIEKQAALYKDLQTALISEGVDGVIAAMILSLITINQAMLGDVGNIEGFIALTAKNIAATLQRHQERAEATSPPKRSHKRKEAATEGGATT